MKNYKAEKEKKNLLGKLELGSRGSPASAQLACGVCVCHGLRATVPQRGVGTAAPGFAAALRRHLRFVLVSFPSACRAVLCVRSWQHCLRCGSSGVRQGGDKTVSWCCRGAGFSAFPQESVVWLKNSQVLKAVFGKFTGRVKLRGFPRVRLSCASEVRPSAWSAARACASSLHCVPLPTSGCGGVTGGFNLKSSDRMS